MPRVARPDPQVLAAAQDAVRSAETLEELRRALTVLLPAVARITLAQTAGLLGVSRATAGRLQQAFRARLRGAPPPAPWGGRRRAALTLADEEQFLAPWVERAAQGAVLVVGPLRRAYEEHVGHRVAKTTVYRLLARHGWRKVAPDTAHPKADPVAQEAWKKNSPKRWRKC